MEPEFKKKSLHEINLSPINEAMCEFNGSFELEGLEEQYTDKLSDLENSFLNESKTEVSNDELNLHEEDEEEFQEFDLEEKAIEAVEAIRQSAFDYICKRYAQDLARTGLLIELSSPLGYRYQDEGDQRGMGIFDEMMTYFKINNAHNFISYLKAFKMEQISDERLKGLRGVGKDLLWQLKDDYDLADPDDERSINLLSHMSSIVEHFKAIDDPEFSDDLVELSVYAQLAQKRILREVLLAERLDIVQMSCLEITNEKIVFTQDLEKYPPANWHRVIFTSVSDYKVRWGEVLDALKVISQNESAVEFFTDLTGILKDALIYAKANPGLIESSYHSQVRTDEEIDAIRIVIDDVFHSLQEC